MVQGSQALTQKGCYRGMDTKKEPDYASGSVGKETFSLRASWQETQEQDRGRIDRFVRIPAA
jgi:hypothetical protein